VSIGVCYPQTTRPTGTLTQVREIDTTAPGGALSSGRILLAQSARNLTIGQAVVSRDGTSVTAIVLSGPRIPTGQGFIGQVQLSVVRFSVATGNETAVLFQTRDPAALLATLTADSSGRFLILGHSFFLANHMGWLDHGHLRMLPAEGGAPAAW
jgi:hypothetical protein